LAQEFIKNNKKNY